MGPHLVWIITIYRSTETVNCKTSNDKYTHIYTTRDCTWIKHKISLWHTLYWIKLTWNWSENHPNGPSPNRVLDRVSRGLQVYCYSGGFVGTVLTDLFSLCSALLSDGDAEEMRGEKRRPWVARDAMEIEWKYSIIILQPSSNWVNRHFGDSWWCFFWMECIPKWLIIHGQVQR